MPPIEGLAGGYSRGPHLLEPRDRAKFDEIQAACEYFDQSEEALIQILHRAQEVFGYLRDDVIKFVARELRLPPSRVYGVVTFYSFFSTTPLGRYTVMVCMGTACYVRGADKLIHQLEKELGIKVGDTTHDGMFSLRTARCIGACGMAPVVVIGEDVHSKVQPDQVKKILKAYR